jgi:hypothetical protein
VIWSLVSGLVRQGWFTPDTTIDLIYIVYGQQTSVTDIINDIKKDQKDGTLNPNLQIELETLSLKTLVLSMTVKSVQTTSNNF